MPRLEFGRRLRSRFWRPTPREEVDAELRFHLEMRARELERQGLTPEAARAEARRRFGDLSGSRGSAGRSRQEGIDAWISPTTPATLRAIFVTRPVRWDGVRPSR